MTVYKLQIWLAGDETLGEKNEFRDFHFDVEKISGFYIPNDEPEMLPNKSICVFIEGDWIGIKQEPHILKYLKERFGSAVTNN